MLGGGDSDGLGPPRRRPRCGPVPLPPNVDGHLIDGHLIDGHLIDGNLIDGHLIDGHLDAYQFRCRGV